MSDFGDTSALKPGDCFGDYTVERLLGKGGMGSVYLMRTSDGSPFAVKIMHRSEMSHDSRVRFVREAEFAMNVRHKNLVTVYDVGEDPDTGLCYIIMDYLPGGTLSDRIKENGKLSIADAVKITMHIAAGLDVAHRNGLVHRDVKPDNIMFDADGTPKLADLGVAKFGEDRKTMVTMTGMMIGTPAYMSPEQFIDSHRIDARSDIYSLGVVFYEMLAGKRPNSGSTAVELLAKAVKGEPLPDIRTVCPEVSAAIANVLSMMCAPKPDDRPATTMEVSDILQRAATGRFVIPKKPPRVIEACKKIHWFKISAVAAGAVLLLAGAVFTWQAYTGRRQAKTPTLLNVNLPPGVRSAVANDYQWFYREENGNAVLSADGDGGRCLYPMPKGRVTVPTELDGRKVTVIGERAFANCDGMTEIILPEGIEEIRGWSSFVGCRGLSEVRLPQSLQKIGLWTFEGCTGLKRVNLMNCSSSHSGFGCLFVGCRVLDEILCSPDNPAICSKDGALYSKKGDVLLAYPKTRTAVLLPSGVREISNSALVSINLKHVKIPEGVEFVHGNNFEHDEMGVLESVEFPRSLKRVGEFLFKKTESIKRVIFHGDAPLFTPPPFGWTPAQFVVEVERGSKGWNGPGSTSLPRRWPVGAGVDSRSIRYIGEMGAQPTTNREVQMSDVPPEFRNDLEKLRSRYTRRVSRNRNGRFVFGRLKVEDSSIEGVATWAWLNKDGTFTAAAIMAAKDGLVFMKNGYETLVVRLDDADRPWRDDVALDLGTVTLRKLPREKTATITLTAHLPKGVESGTFTLMLENRSPCGIDWGTWGRERTSQEVAKVPFFSGRKVTIPGCATAPYTLILEANGCPKYSRFQDRLSPGVTDIEGISLMRTKTASFAIRPYGDKGGAWRRCKVAVDGKTPLMLLDEKDKSGNRCRLYLNAYGDSGKSVFSHFGWGNTTCEDLGAMTVAEFERREKDNVHLATDDKKRNSKLIPGHIYRLKNDWHWHIELAIAFESYEEAPQGGADSRSGVNPDLEIASPATHVAKSNGYHWFYRLEGNRAVLCRRDLPGGRRPCVERAPEGRVVVPGSLDGHRVVAIDDCAFFNCDKIVEVVLPEGLEEICGWRSFGGCKSLKEFVFPNSLKTCGTLTFYGCTNLKRVNLSNCTRTDSGFGCLFDNCHSLGQVLCSRQNPVVTSVDGVLYSKDKKTLLAYPKTRKELAVLPATCNIANTALVSLPYRHVKIPDGIEYVSSHNFEFDERGTVETVEFPRSLKKLGFSQFKKTTSAKRVIFNGDAPEVEMSPFSESKSDIIVEVRRGSKGWNGPDSTDLPERWPVGAGDDSRPIRYIDDGDAHADGAVGGSATVVPYVSKNKLHAAYRSKDRKRVFVEVCHQHTHDSFRTPPYTIDRLKEVINDKADILLLTLARSKDGVLFSAERENIENISTGTGSFGDYTAAQLKRMNVKHRGLLTTEGFAKLEDMIRVGKGKILFKICGFREYAKELDELLERLDAWESVMVESWELPADRNVCSPRMWSNILSGKLQVTALGTSFADWREVETECTAYGGNEDLKARGMLGIPQRVFGAFTYDPGTGDRTDDEAGWEKALKDGITVFRTNRPKKLIKFLKRHNRRKGG